jgi:hypothetical protein
MGKIFQDFNYAPYQSQYVPAPVQELMMAGTALQKRADDLYAQTSESKNLLATQEVAPGDVADRDLHVSTLEKEFDELIKKYNGAWEDPKFGRESRDLVAKYARDPKIQGWTESLKNYKYRDAAIKEYGDEGIDYNPYNNYRTIQEDGTIAPYTAEVTKMLQWDPRKEQMWNQVEDDAYAMGLSRADFGMLKSGQTGGISQQKIDNLLSLMNNRYLGTPEGKQELKYYQKVQGLSEQDARRQVKESLRAAGYERVHTKQDVNYHQDPTYDNTRGNGTNKPPEGARIESSPLEDVEYKLPIDPNKLIDKIRSVYTTPGLGDKNTSGRFVEKKGYGDFTIEERKVLDQLSQRMPGKNQEETYNNVRMYLEAIKEKKISVPYFAYEPSKSDEETKYTKDNILARPFMDPSTGEVITGTDLWSKLGESIKADTRTIGEYSSNNFFMDLSGDERFSQPQVLKVKDKLYVMGMSKGELESASGQQKVMLNKISTPQRTQLPTNLPELEEPGRTNVYSDFDPKTGNIVLSWQENGKPRKEAAPTATELIRKYYNINQ